MTDNEKFAKLKAERDKLTAKYCPLMSRDSSEPVYCLMAKCEAWVEQDYTENDGYCHYLHRER